MQLKSVRVENFRSVLDSTPFRIDRVTCLVGKNESGKTAILHALRELRPIAGTSRPYNKDLDYPRARINRYAELHGEKQAKVLSTVWELDATDISAVEGALGKGVLKNNEVTLTKSYGQSGETWSMPLDENVVLNSLAQAYNVSAESRKALLKCTTTEAAAEFISTLGEQASAELKSVKEAIAKYRDNNCVRAAIDVLAPRLPQFFYFGSYDQMNGKVALQELQAQVASNTTTAKNRVFLAFLDFAGIPLNEIPQLNSFETLFARLEGAS